MINTATHHAGGSESDHENSAILSMTGKCRENSWRKAMREARLSASYAAKKTPLVGDTAHNGDHLGVISASTPGGQATKLETLLPRRADSRLVRTMRLGMIGQTRVRISRQNSGSCPKCPYCDVDQTSPHVMLACPIGAEMRSAVSAVYDACTSSKPWHQPALTFQGKLNHVLSNTSPIPKEADKALKRAVMPTLHVHMGRLSSRLAIENPKPTLGPVVQRSCAKGSRTSLPTLYTTTAAGERNMAATLDVAGPCEATSIPAPIPTLEELMLRATVAIAADSTTISGRELP